MERIIVLCHFVCIFPPMKTALILGSTGLTGSSLLTQLLTNDNYERIYILNRSKHSVKHPKITEIITDFSDKKDWESIPKVDTIFSCLGTTKKQTSDLVLYRTIEIGIPEKVSRSFFQKGVTNFHFISSIGANANSKNFYQKIKGEAEERFKAFPISSVYIYQPGFLRGDRKAFRLGEKFFSYLIPFFDLFCKGKGAKYHSVHVDELAKGMIQHDLSKKSEEKIRVLHYPF